MTLEALTSIKTSDDKIQIINQLLLPHTTEWLVIDTIEQAHDAIKTMKVSRHIPFLSSCSLMAVRQIRGAPAIASLAALSVSQHLTRALRADPPPDFLSSPVSLAEHVTSILDFLFTARPTAVNLGAATRRLSRTLGSAPWSGRDARAVAEDVIEDGRQIAAEDVGRNKAMAKWGGDWLVEQVKGEGGSGDGLNVLTVCNTGSLATSVRISLSFSCATARPI
jgi:methylthioribose-1-phosphate isomerase